MDNFRFVLNSAGVRELLKSSAMQSILREHAEATRNGCGDLSDDYIAEVKVGGTRARATIKADTPHAHYSNLKHNTLLKALK